MGLRTESFWQRYPDALKIAYFHRETHSYREIARILTEKFGEQVTYASVRGKLRNRNPRKKSKPPSLITEKAVLEQKPQLSTSKTPYLIYLPTLGAVSGRETSLLVSDIHIPFQLPYLEVMVAEYSGKVDRLIIMGDFLDQYAVSSFVKDKDIQLKKEFLMGYRLLQKWCIMFPEVMLFPGNHDMRLDRHIRSNLLPTVQFLFPQNFLLKQYKTGFDIKDEQENLVHCPGLDKLIVHDDWYIEVGDAILAHPLDYTGVEGRTAIWTDEYFRRRGFTHRAMILGHTHQVAKIIDGNERGQDGLMMEIGCNCLPMDYAKCGKVRKTRKPQVSAYGLLVQYNGITDINETRYVVTREGVPEVVTVPVPADK